MTKCEDGCHAVCNHCVYMYKHHRPELHEAGEGLCTFYRQVKSYADMCEHFFCRNAVTNEYKEEETWFQVWYETPPLRSVNRVRVFAKSEQAAMTKAKNLISINIRIKSVERYQEK